METIIFDVIPGIARMNFVGVWKHDMVFPWLAENSTGLISLLEMKLNLLTVLK